MFRTIRAIAFGAAFLAGMPLMAQDGCTGGCGTQVFGTTGNRLTELLNRTHGTSCGESCSAAADSCGEGCGEGTGLTDSGSSGFRLGSLFGLDEDSSLQIGGWLQSGYHSRNSAIPRFNTHADRYNLHQGYLYLEKVADGSAGGDFGFRFDAVYGVDGADTQSFGNNPGRWDFGNGFDHGSYAFALPQAYVEYASGDWNIKAGHFYTLIGDEVVTAPDNFFYSHTFTMNNSEPFTHTGVVGTWRASDDVTVYGGWTLGWDTGFDQFGNGNNFLGGAALSLTDDATLTYMTTIGDFGSRGEGYSHSLVLDVTVTDDLNYVLQSDLLDTDGTFTLLNTVHDDVQYGVNQYLLYTIDDQWAAGVRYEWWNVDGTSVNDVTIGLNFRPADHIVIRPEFRHDWAPGADYARSFFGVDSIVTF